MKNMKEGGQKVILRKTGKALNPKYPACILSFIAEMGSYCKPDFRPPHQTGTRRAKTSEELPAWAEEMG